MRRLVSAVLLFFGFGHPAAVIAAPNAPTKTPPPAAQDRPDFASRLHGQLAAKKGNLFYSPLSIRMAMAMAQAGAAGETANEMKEVLGLGDDPATTVMKLRADFKALAEPGMPAYARQANDPVTQKYAEADIERRRLVLRVVNRLWGERSRKFNEPFVANLRDRYGAPMETLDFKHAPEPSRVTINTWVSDQTEKRIEDLVPEGAVNTDTSLIITNAVYFKAQWTNQFETAATKNETFHAPGGPKQAPMMHQLDHFRVAHIDNGLMLELPYGSGALAMDLLLPDARNGIEALEKRFADGALTGWVAKLADKRVDVAMPSFKTQLSLQLADVLTAMGMKRVFKFGQADFSAMDGTHELFISKVVHQAFVAVDEQGTEAAAATAVMMEAGAAPVMDEPLKFRADHPFLIVIRDTRNGEALFVGRIVDPKT